MPEWHAPGNSARSPTTPSGLCPRCRAKHSREATKILRIYGRLDSGRQVALGTLARSIGGSYQGTDAGVADMETFGWVQTFTPDGPPHPPTYVWLTEKGRRELPPAREKANVFD